MDSDNRWFMDGESTDSDATVTTRLARLGLADFGRKNS